MQTGCGTLHVEAFFDPETGELRECYLSKGSTGGCNNFMIGLSRMMSLAARGGIGINNILDQLKSCGTCPAYAVRQATKKDTSKGSCCPVAVGNALKEMSDEIQDIICTCKENNPKEFEITFPESWVEGQEKFIKDLPRIVKTSDWNPNLPWWGIYPPGGDPDVITSDPGIHIQPDGSVIHDCVLRQTPDHVNPIKVTYSQEPIKISLSSLEECPQCHERTLIHQGGCIQCNSCGYSKCS